jgi:hypothetical protein
LAGFLFRSNLFYVSLIMCRLSGLYWIALFFGGVLYRFRFSVGWLTLFILQKDFLRTLSGLLNRIKRLNHSLSSLLEPFHLALSLYWGSFSLAQTIRLVILSSFVVFLILMF